MTELVEAEEAVVKKKNLKQWESYIGTSLKKTAEATLDTAKRIAEFKASTEEDQFNKKMKQWFNFSPAHLSYWTKINDALPRFASATTHLPASTRTLYELASIDDNLWAEFIETGDIHPALTVEGAKSLKTSGGLMKAAQNKYAEADNYLEIMTKLKEIKNSHESVISAKKEFMAWLKKNPPIYHEDEDDEDFHDTNRDGTTIDSTATVIAREAVKATSPQVRLKCLALFGIFVDQPITDKEVLTFLDSLAGNDETKLAAIETLEND